MNMSRTIKISDARRMMFFIGLLTAAFTGFLLLTKQAAMQSDASPVISSIKQPDVLGKLAYQPTVFFTGGFANIYVSVINADGSGNTTLAGSIPIYNGEPAWSPDGTKIAYVAQVNSFDIYVMNADGTNKINLTNSTAQERNPSWSATGKIAYERDTLIWTMNADGTNQMPFSISQNAPMAPAWSPDGSKMAFASNGEIWVINADGTGARRVTNNSTVDADPAWSPDGAKIVFGKGGSGIAVINLDGTNETNLTNGATDGKPTWSSDGTKIAYVSNGIYVMNANGSGQSVLIPNIPNPRGQTNDNPAWQPVPAPPNTFAISGRITRGTVGLNNVTISLTGTTTATTTTDARGNYQFTNLPGGGNYTITPLLAGHVFTPPSRSFTNLNAAQNADFTATGTGLCQGGRPCPANGRIVFNRNTSATMPDIYTINPDGSDAVRLTPQDIINDTDPSYSPDGTKILFVTTRDGITGIYRIDADGANIIRLTNSSSDKYPSYSPDGATIVFVRNQKIYKMNADGTNPVQLTNSSADDEHPTFSPDGTKIAFSRGSSFPSYIYTMNADGSNQVRVTNSASVREQYPSYSPDGRNIVFSESGRIYVVNTDGSNLTLISSGVFGYKPSYSPDGTKIVFSARDFTGDIVKIYTINADGSERTLVTTNADLPDWQPIPRARPVLFDFDGDGKADVSVFRPSNGYWYRFNSSNNSFFAVQFGQAGDKPAPADYDGDGRTDIAVFREGAFAYFFILNSSDNTFRFAQFGTTGDLPVVGDWDGDGKADLAVYRGGNTIGSQSNFYYRPSSQPNVDYNTIVNGTGGKPVVGDFDGDGRIDAALVLPSAVWEIRRSSDNQITQTTFGIQSDIPVPADFDGDGRTNIAVFRPSNGTWYTSQNAANNYGAIVFGANGDLPVPADYDGDGRVDAAVFRPSAGAWYLQRSTSGFTGVQFGTSEDKPSPNAFIP